MSVYLEQHPDKATLEALADFICGDGEKFPVYRSSNYLTRFFQNIGINKVHDGSTRKWWALETLESLSLEEIEKVILRLVDIREYKGDRESLKKAVEAMNGILLMENFEIELKGKDPILTSLELKDSILKNVEKTSENYEEMNKIPSLSMPKKLEEWYEQWWAKYLIFPITVLIIAGIVLWQLGING